MKRLIVGVAAFSIAWAATASNDPVADVRQILAGTVTTKSVKTEYLTGKRDGTAAFQGALSAYKAVRAAETATPPPPAVTWTKCADEGQACVIVGTARIRYGSGSSWLTQTITGGITCNYIAFGLSAPRATVSHCETDGKLAPAPTPTPTPTPTSPNPCYIYDPATKQQVALAASFCPAKACPGYPNPVPYQDPCPVVTSWAPAPLQVNGYARLRNGPDLIVRLVATGITTDVDPDHRQHWWAIQFQQDASGNFPASNAYWKGHIGYNFDDGLIGVQPGPISP